MRIYRICNNSVNFFVTFAIFFKSRIKVKPSVKLMATEKMVTPTARLRLVCTHKSTPEIDRKIMLPASVSTSKIHGVDMPVPLCRLVSVAKKPLAVVVTPTERLPRQYSA